MATESFKEAYGVLQQHAQTLREQREPSIDDLLTIVTESVQAYKVCQQRIPPCQTSCRSPEIADDPHWSAIHDNKSTFN